MKPLGDNPRPRIPDALLGILLHTLGVTGEQHGEVRTSGSYSDGWPRGWIDARKD